MAIDYKQVALDMNREICGGDPHKATALLQDALDADTGWTHSQDMRLYLLDQLRIMTESIAKIADEVERWRV